MAFNKVSLFPAFLSSKKYYTLFRVIREKIFFKYQIHPNRAKSHLPLTHFLSPVPTHQLNRSVLPVTAARCYCVVYFIARIRLAVIFGPGSLPLLLLLHLCHPLFHSTLQRLLFRLRDAAPRWKKARARAHDPCLTSAP